MTDRPETFSLTDGRPRPDLLSEALVRVRLRGGAAYHAQLDEPWRLRFPSGSHHIHVVVQGRAEALLGDGGTVSLKAGDVLLLDGRHGHELRFDPLGNAPVLLGRDAPGAGSLMLGNGAGDTRIIGGAFRYERPPLPPLLQTLPPTVHVGFGAQPPPWLDAVVHFLMEEASVPDPGSALMLSRLIELLVIRTLRSWARTDSRAAVWIGGGADARFAAVLEAIHDRPADPWSVAGLARLAGMSRSVFSERFTACFGMPPLRYLSRWRLSLAAELLAGGDLSVGEIGRSVGYGSEPGFSRAFRSLYGVAPAPYRVGRRLRG